MEAKLLLRLTLLSLLSAIALSSTSQDYSHSIASAPSSSAIPSSYGGFNLQVFSSLFFRRFKVGVSRSLAISNPRGRNAAEVESNVTRGALAPAPAPGPAISVNGSRAAERTKEKSDAVKWLLGVAVGLATGALSAILASVAFKIIHEYVKRGPKANQPMVYQKKVINSKAIDFLKSAVAGDGLDILGRGGSGEVYKATLENGRVVAIKKVLGVAKLVDGAPGAVDPKLESSYDLTKNSSQIKAELDTLGQIRHRNLVTLLAYIPLPDAHLLIYDYMENGSLHDVLNKVREGSLELPWETRFNIAQGVAMGLKYLHYDGKDTIVHCDLKAGNILLDKEMVPHIGDFGLAKIIPDSFTHFTSINLAGTIGYIPPEYHQVCRYTTKGDMYGFGAVLVVLLTGKEPTHQNFSDVYTHLGNYLADVLSAGEQSVVEILDPQLLGHGDEAEMLLTLKIAIFCLNENPAHRPSSNDVLTMLGQVRGHHPRPSPMISIPIEAL